MPTLPPESDSDQENMLDWIERAQSGDLGAFGNIVRAEQDRVRAYFAVRLARSGEAEDLAQEVFLIAFRKLHEFEPSRPIRPWLKGIAHNLLRNHVRKFRAEPIGGSEELQLVLDSYYEQHEKSGDLAPALEALAECLDELGGAARDLVSARYLQGESIKEMCKRTSRRHSALTMQLHRIRATLADCVGRKLAAPI